MNVISHSIHIKDLSLKHFSERTVSITDCIIRVKKSNNNLIPILYLWYRDFILRRCGAGVRTEKVYRYADHSGWGRCIYSACFPYGLFTMGAWNTDSGSGSAACMLNNIQ